MQSLVLRCVHVRLDVDITEKRARIHLESKCLVVVQSSLLLCLLTCDITSYDIDSCHLKPNMNIMMKTTVMLQKRLIKGRRMRG